MLPIGNDSPSRRLTAYLCSRGPQQPCQLSLSLTTVAAETKGTRPCESTFAVCCILGLWLLLLMRMALYACYGSQRGLGSLPVVPQLIFSRAKARAPATADAQAYLIVCYILVVLLPNHE